ncbi:uncharacterized protein FIBRA_07545 [Fibroporia radiculosa]|uniref:Protein PBN1 n=1 Tax=Fibroporia radiculosa TaxID=599839 RepID=J4IBV7_9APHY|nr:uncharacterized protein FIBRA_07545 [Fibroporia radiculosa]CCM05331.1 predicted protein [Fibroporia radiculosa]
MPAASLSSSLSAQGFHFTYSTRVHVEDVSAVANCSLHIVHVLPPDVYADQYELALRPGYASSLRGTSDLERPVAAVDKNGSVLLIDVEIVEDTRYEYTVDIPLHARYGHPAEESGRPYHTIILPPPLGFWACPTSELSRPFPEQLVPHVSPDAFAFSSISLIPHTPSDERAEVTIPVGKLGDLAMVDIGTAAVMLIMFSYIVVVSIRTARRLRHDAHKVKGD